MSRRRMLDPSYWEDESVGGLSDKARLLLLCCISQADDYGKLSGSPATLKKIAFGFTDTTIAEVELLLSEISEQVKGFHYYEVDGKRFIALLHWYRYQRVDHPGNDFLPDPPDTQFNPPSKPVKSDSKPNSQNGSENETRQLTNQPSTNQPENEHAPGGAIPALLTTWIYLFSPGSSPTQRQIRAANKVIAELVGYNEARAISFLVAWHDSEYESYRSRNKEHGPPALAYFEKPLQKYLDGGSLPGRNGNGHKAGINNRPGWRYVTCQGKRYHVPDEIGIRVDNICEISHKQMFLKGYSPISGKLMSTVMREHCDIKAEQSVIGSLMIEPAKTPYVAAIVKPQDFYRPTHRLIMAALLDYHKEHPNEQNCDFIYVQDHIRKTGENPDVWECCRYLQACIEEAITAANAEIHARMVREKSALRSQQYFQAELGSKLQKPDAEPDQVAAWAQGQLEEMGRTCDTDLVRIGDVLHPHLDYLQESSRRDGLEGYTTGFSALDCVTGGYGQPMFVLLKGKRKKGKTHHLIGLACNCLKSGRAAVLFSMDTPRRIMLNRLLGYLSGVNSFRVQRLCGEDEWAAVTTACEWLWTQPLFLCERSGHTVSEIEAKCRNIVSQGHNIGPVAIDYAELMRPDSPAGNREQELAQIAVGLQNLRNRLGTTIVLLSQINKEGTARRCEGLENASDLILNWNVTEYNRGKGEGMLITEGNRLGADAVIHCRFDFGTSRIRETELQNSGPSYPAVWPWWYDPANDEQETLERVKNIHDPLPCG